MKICIILKSRDNNKRGVKHTRERFVGAKFDFVNSHLKYCNHIFHQYFTSFPHWFFPPSHLWFFFLLVLFFIILFHSFLLLSFISFFSVLQFCSLSSFISFFSSRFICLFCSFVSFFSLCFVLLVSFRSSLLFFSFILPLSSLSFRLSLLLFCFVLLFRFVLAVNLTLETTFKISPIAYPPPTKNCQPTLVGLGGRGVCDVGGGISVCLQCTTRKL